MILCISNYTPGTYLSGWDTLHPEFNFGLAFHRMFEGVWRADQGLGAVMTQAHMVDIPRTIFLYILSFVFPLGLLRYLYVFACLLIGPLSIYRLVRVLLEREKKCDVALVSNVALISALWYLCNLGTIQHFILEIEIYPAQYAFGPLLYLATLYCLEHWSTRRLIFLFFVNIALLMQAHTPTFFYVFGLCYGVYLSSYIFSNKNSFRKAFIVGALFLVTNLFWILPNIYTAVVHGTEIRESKVNRLFSPDAFAKNQAFSTLPNLVSLKNFLFDWGIYDSNSRNNFTQILDPWNVHLDNPSQFIPFIFFGFMIIGVWSILHKRNHNFLPFLISGIIPTVMLLNGTSIISSIFAFIEGFSPLIKELLRFPFTKFSIPYMIVFAIILGQGLYAVLVKCKLTTQDKFVKLLIFLHLIFFIPAFQGNLIHKAVRISIPKNYFNLFAYMQSQDPSGRVALLPIHSFWNWTYYSWGYQGAGFLQFGIPQPILDRDYDRWNPSNEQYFREMSYAVYSQKVDILAQTLRKFHIKWIVLDKSVIDPGKTTNSKLDWLIPSLLEKTNYVEKVATFGQDIYLYRTRDQNTSATYLMHPTNWKEKLNGAHVDPTYLSNGDYIVSSDGAEDPQRVFINSLERYVGPLLDPMIEISITNRTPSSIVECEPNSSVAERKSASNNIIYTAQAGATCDSWVLPDIDHAHDHVLEIESENVSGFPLELCIKNLLTNHCTLFTNLHTGNMRKEYFFMPQMSDYGYGYSINLRNYSGTRQLTSTNMLRQLKIYKIDTPFSVNNSSRPNSYLKNVDIRSMALSSYTVLIADIKQSDTQADNVLSIDQAYDPGWLAYDLTGANWLQRQVPILFADSLRLKDHVLVNNWANGWRLEERSNEETRNKETGNREIVVIFWPQYLQYLGFAVLLVTMIVLIIPRYRRVTR